MMKFWKWFLPLQKSNKINFLDCFSKDLRAYLPAVFFLTSFVLQVSCRKPENIIGLGVQPPEDRVDALFTVQDVKTTTVKGDSIRTDQTIYNLAGNLNDPIFGKANASFYSQVRLLTSNVKFDASAIVDSIVLNLKYQSFYGDTTTPQTFRVYEITQDVAIGNQYYSNSNIAFSPNEIGIIQNFIPNPRSSHLSIKLDNALGQRFLDADSSKFVNNTSFVNFFKGFYVKPDLVPGNGGIISFDLLSAVSKMTMYYRTATDTLSFDFVINENSSRINKFELDYTGTEVAAALVDPLENQKNVYVQSMGGVRTKVVLPDLATILDDNTIVINNAVLIVPVKGDYGIYTPPERLRIVAVDSLGRLLEIPDFLEGSTHYGGTFNATTKEYRFNISRHLLFTLRGTPNYSLLLLPSGAAANANRAVLLGNAADENKMRLQIIYTKL
ncbi:MAG: DUF4270 domain-containing protein [Bacteroidota bacterium]|nr:DUF4270 domain-containing protein [Bacteroidota bacterium]